MDGVFMIKIVKTLWILTLVLAMFVTGILVADKHTLSSDLIRLRVVAASDSAEDQRVKLEVRDTITSYLRENMPADLSVSEAKAFLKDNLEEMTEIARNKLDLLGVHDSVKVYLCREAADAKRYETFSLPSGVYKTLRVDIGDANGENWWCVVFPSLCIPETVEAFEDEAVACGVPEGLSDTLSNDGGHEIRFFLLDCIGKIENLFKKG